MTHSGSPYIVFDDPEVPSIHGKWFERSIFKWRHDPLPHVYETYVATGEFETRDDGVRAEIYRPTPDGSEDRSE